MTLPNPDGLSRPRIASNDQSSHTEGAMKDSATAGRLQQRRLQYRALHTILQRRDSQDARWGDPAHDDTHSRQDWVALLLGLAATAHLAQSDVLAFEHHLIDIAVAVAAIEALRRNNTGTSK